MSCECFTEAQTVFLLAAMFLSGLVFGIYIMLAFLDIKAIDKHHDCRHNCTRWSL